MRHPRLSSRVSGSPSPRRTAASFRSPCTGRSDSATTANPPAPGGSWPSETTVGRWAPTAAMTKTAQATRQTAVRLRPGWRRDVAGPGGGDRPGPPPAGGGRAVPPQPPARTGLSPATSSRAPAAKNMPARQLPGRVSPKAAPLPTRARAASAAAGARIRDPRPAPWTPASTAPARSVARRRAPQAAKGEPHGRQDRRQGQQGAGRQGRRGQVQVEGGGAHGGLPPGAQARHHQPAVPGGAGQAEGAADAGDDQGLGPQAPAHRLRREPGGQEQAGLAGPLLHPQPEEQSREQGGRRR